MCSSELFTRYSACKTPLEVVAAQNAWLTFIEAERNNKIEVLYPPSHSEDEGEEEQPEQEEAPKQKKQAPVAAAAAAAAPTDSSSASSSSVEANADTPAAVAVEQVAAQLADAQIAQ